MDRNGVILTQNARAMRSKKSGEKNKVGEKSRQAAKIDKAKDLIDEVLEAGVGMDSNVSQCDGRSVVVVLVPRWSRCLLLLISPVIGGVSRRKVSLHHTAHSVR